MKKLILLFTVTSFAPSYAGLFPGPTQQEPRAWSQGGTCTDFSGLWKGKCLNTPQSTDDTFEIEQNGCNYLSTKKEHFVVGGTRTTVETDPQLALGGSSAMVRTSTMALDWNQDKTELLGHGAWDWHEAGAASSGGAVAFTGRMGVKGKRLMAEFSVAGKPFRCVYDKQN